MIVVRPLGGAAIEGQPTTLRCQGQAQDKPKSFWYKVTAEGQEVLLPGGNTNIRVNNGNLQFVVSQGYSFSALLFHHVAIFSE